MCCEDKQIGRESGSTMFAIPVATTSTPILSPNPRRIAIIFLGATSQIVHAGTIDPAVAGVGIHVATSGTPREVRIEVYGREVTKAWYAIAGSGATTLSLVEVIDNTCKR